MTHTAIEVARCIHGSLLLLGAPAGTSIVNLEVRFPCLCSTRGSGMVPAAPPSPESPSPWARKVPDYTPKPKPRYAA